MPTYQGALLAVPVDNSSPPIPLVGGGAPTVWPGVPINLLDATGNLIAGFITNPTTLNNGVPANGNAQDLVITGGVGAGAGRGSRVRFVSPLTNSGTGASVTLNEYGIGITNGYGGDTQAVSGVPLNIQTLVTDPVGNQAGAQHLMTLAATGANAAGGNAGNFTIYTSTSAFSFTGTWAPLDVEVYMQGAAGATYTGLTAITALPHTEATSGANVTNFKAVTGSPTHKGTGTITTCIAFDSAITNQGSGGAADGAITTATGYRSGFTFNGTAASAGNTTTLTGFQQLAAIFGPGATHQLLTVNGLSVQAQINTVGGTSTTGGFVTNGALIILGTQGGNTSGTNTHKGIYITGNGGTPGAGGTVLNYAIFSDSTAASQLGGALTITAGGLVVQGGGLDITGTSTIRGAITMTATPFSFSAGAVTVIGTSDAQDFDIKTGGTARFDFKSAGDFRPHAAGTTAMTVGFIYIPSAAGAPTGVPTSAAAGFIPLYYDSTNNFLYVYNGGWKKSTVYA